MLCCDEREEREERGGEGGGARDALDLDLSVVSGSRTPNMMRESQSGEGAKFGRVVKEEKGLGRERWEKKQRQ